MYNVNTARINEILDFFSGLLTSAKQLVNMNQDEFLGNRLVILAAERTAHLLIECITDVGNLLIDGFIMRDPGSLEDIILVLGDEGVLPGEAIGDFIQFVRLRKNVVHDYLHVDGSVIHAMLTEHFATLQKFPSYIRDYLKKELW